MDTRPMRRSDRALGDGSIETILRHSEHGVLATAGADGTPYAVPLSYIWMEGAVWFHCAAEGRKTDNLRVNPAVCFTVARPIAPVYKGGFSTYYESVVITGRAQEIIGEAEKRAALRALCEKYLPDHMDRFEGAMKALPHTAVYRIVPERITGKGHLPQE